MTLLSLYLLFALGGSFLCSVLEAVLLTTPVSFIEVMEKKGFASAKALKKIKVNIDRPLAAILSFNTIAHTIGAVGVGAQATIVFENLSYGLISGILTVLILVFSEIIPKTIGAKYWRNLALPSAKIINLIIILMYPFVIMAELISKLLTGNKNEHTISRDELSAMADIGTKEGIFEERENKIIQSLIRLKGVRAEDIMTPRVVVTTANENSSINQFLAERTHIHYSRIPLYSSDKDNITGYVTRKLVLDKQIENAGQVHLKEIKRPIVAVYSKAPVFKVWEILLENKEHIATVIDEFGGLDGIITMEDIIETILGLEITDETDQATDMQEYARMRWKERQLKYNILKDIDDRSSEISDSNIEE